MNMEIEDMDFENIKMEYYLGSSFCRNNNNFFWKNKEWNRRGKNFGIYRSKIYTLKKYVHYKYIR